MCLETINKKPPSPTGVGYKVFLKDGRFLFGQFSTGGRRIGRWLKSGYYGATDRATSINGAYTPGFHVYVAKSAAEFEVEDRIPCLLVVRKVHYRKARLAGIGKILVGDKIKRVKVIVADEIYIEPSK